MFRRPAPIALAILLAACSSAPAPSPAPADASGAAPSATPAVPGAASERPSPGGGAPGSPAPASWAPPAPSSIAASPAATAAAIDTGGWRTVLAPLRLPAAYVDIGFAANGDLIVTGTDDITKQPTSLWIARYSTDGTLQHKHAVDRTADYVAAEGIDIDRSTDDVLIQDNDVPSTTFHLLRIDSATGKTLANLKLQYTVTRVAVDPAGKLFGITPTYTTWSNMRPCLLDRLTTKGGIATGVDSFLKTCDTIGYTAPPAYFGTPMALDIGRDGRIVMTDDAEAGYRRNREPGGVGVSVLTTGFDLIRHWHVDSDLKPGSAEYFMWSMGLSPTADSKGRVFLAEILFGTDYAISGYRVRVFDPDGTALTTYGTGADDRGVTGPTAPAIDAADRLWVIDRADGGWAIKVLDQAPHAGG